MIGVVLTIAAAVGICLVVYARLNYGVLEAMGIPVLKPTFFMGSVPDLHLKVQTQEDINRFKEFGPIWGVMRDY